MKNVPSGSAQAGAPSLLALIEAKRDGGALTSDAIAWFVRDFTAGRIPDYQAAAMLMAIFFRGMSAEETRALTLAMRDSGEVLRFPPTRVRSWTSIPREASATRFPCRSHRCWRVWGFACR